MRYLVLLSLPLLAVFSPEALAQAKKPMRTTYEQHVLPILKDKCVACHSSDKKRGGLVLNNYTLLMQGGSSGVCVKPGDPDNSLLYQLMSHAKEPIMPPKSPKPPAALLAVVHKWISDGAPENSGSKVVVAQRPKVDFTLKGIAKGKPAVPPMPPAGMKDEPLARAAHDTAITALATNPWSPLVAVAGQKQILLYNADTLDLIGVLPFPEGTATVLKFSRNGGLLIAGGGRAGKSGKVVVWSVATGTRLTTVGDETDAVLAADISPDQSLVALGSPSKMVRIYSTKDGKLVNQIKKHTDWVTALEFSPDGVLLATGDRNGGLFVWEANTAREFFALKGPPKAVTSVSWRPDSNVLAASSEDGTVRLFEMENGRQIRQWTANGGGCLDATYGMDGRIVSVGRDRVAKLFDGNGGLKRSFPALPDVALKAALTYDGKRAIAGDWTGKIAVWSTVDGKELGHLSANPASKAERLVQAKQAHETAKKQRDSVAATAKASGVAYQKVAADLAAAKKAVPDTAAAVRAATTKVAQAKASAAKTQAALQSGQQDVQAKQLLARLLGEAATRMKAEASKPRADASMRAASGRAQTIASQAGTELASAQKAVPALAAAVKTAVAEVAASQKALTTAQAAMQAAPRRIAPLEAALKAAQKKAAADAALVGPAEAALKAAAARLARLEGKPSVVKK